MPLPEVELAQDDEWRRALAPARRLLAAALTFPLLAIRLLQERIRPP